MITALAIVTKIGEVFKNYPQLAVLIQRMAGWIESRIIAAEMERAEREIASALDRAKNTGDTSDVDAAFNR